MGLRTLFGTMGDEATKDLGKLPSEGLMIFIGDLLWFIFFT
jgi:hypothetical protein